MDGSILSGAVGGSIASVIGTICFSIAIWYVKRLIRERDLLAENRLTGFETSLRDQKSRLDQHIKEDKSQELLTEMKHVNGNLEKLTAQVSRALETNAGQSKDIENNKQYISNLREDLQEHIRECNGRK